METMKIIVEQTEQTVTYEVSEDIDIYRIANVLKTLLYAIGYHPDSIEEILPEEFCE